MRSKTQHPFRTRSFEKYPFNFGFIGLSFDDAFFET